uniref:Uncharacterized protein n=1 Tax=Arundo donax TaxID=35708 RepID=A0A0A8XWI8_ARUDO
MKLFLGKSPYYPLIIPPVTRTIKPDICAPMILRLVQIILDSGFATVEVSSGDFATSDVQLAKHG